MLWDDTAPDIVYIQLDARLSVVLDCTWHGNRGYLEVFEKSYIGGFVLV